MTDMTSGSPGNIIIRFTIPILLGNLLQLTYSLADTRIVGSFLGDQALAAVGSISVLVSLYTGFFNGIANGFAIMTARCFGSGEIKKVRSSFAAALSMGFLLSAGFALLTLLSADRILKFLNVPPDLFSASSGYIRILAASMIITMIYNILLASARAIGDSVTPLMTLFLSVGLNIFFDLILIGVFHTGIRGAAAATAAAQGITMLICAVYLVKKYDFFRIRPREFRGIELSMVRIMLLTGLSMGFMSSMINIGSLILQTAVNELGNSFIVAQSAARKITEVLMSIFIAAGYSMATYCSQNYGAGKYSRILQGIRIGYRITCSWCVIVLIIVYLAGPFLIRTITGSQDPVMIEAAVKYLKIDSLLYVLVAVIITLRNSLQGIGDQITPLISSGIEMTGKIILTFTLVPAAGYDGVILTEPIVWIVMIIPLILKINHWKKQHRNAVSRP